MASPILVDIDKMAGKQSCDVFSDDTELGVRAVFWWFDESHDAWRLYVASKYCDRHGPKETYLRLRKHLDEAGLLELIPLDRIVAARTDNPVVDLVKAGVGTFHQYNPGELQIFGGTNTGFKATTSNANPKSIATKIKTNGGMTQSSGVIDFQAKAKAKAKG